MCSCFKNLSPKKVSHYPAKGIISSLITNVMLVNLKGKKMFVLETMSLFRSGNNFKTYKQLAQIRGILGRKNQIN